MSISRQWTVSIQSRLWLSRILASRANCLCRSFPTKGVGVFLVAILANENCIIHVKSLILAEYNIVLFQLITLPTVSSVVNFC